MSQLNKVLQVLAVFTEERPFSSAEEVAARLDIPRTTAFRHLNQLCESGFVTRQSGRYSLGPRIIQLDYLMRRNDPLINASRQVMQSLSAATHCSVLLSSLFGDQILNIHHEAGSDTTHFSYVRGRGLPLFRGAASKIILAHLTSARLRSIYDKHQEEAHAIAGDWRTLSDSLRQSRKNGCYISHGEVDEGVTGIAVPLFGDDGLVAGSLSLVFESQRAGLFNTELLVRMLQQGGQAINEALAQAVQPS
ncbi:Pca regulon regulatory protein [Pigmentiphaga humi]|uniref:Pca regulon regulatory protein n=1 Tax=Pigmentiphaga humi TaxID=2478468 RepID=A0A3P4AY07_9BURK|nr:IclR family transcriptional regulator [Pigmentiphaga humi]VCU68964.1 Pca regulon regulatory protein [Pigmentiphaga humi]